MSRVVVPPRRITAEHLRGGTRNNVHERAETLYRRMLHRTGTAERAHRILIELWIMLDHKTNGRRPLTSFGDEVFDLAVDLAKKDR